MLFPSKKVYIHIYLSPKKTPNTEGGMCWGGNQNQNKIKITTVALVCLVDEIQRSQTYITFWRNLNFRNAPLYFYKVCNTEQALFYVAYYIIYTTSIIDTCQPKNQSNLPHHTQFFPFVF